MIMGVYILNAQLNFLKSNGLLVSMEALVLSALSGNWQSTRQIDNVIKYSVPMIRLSALLSTYNKSGFATTSSFVGSLASSMSKSRRAKHLIINNEHFFKL